MGQKCPNFLDFMDSPSQTYMKWPLVRSGAQYSAQLNNRISYILYKMLPDYGTNNFITFKI